MPDPRTQRYLGWITFFGLFASCFGCGLYANNQIRAGMAFLILAWIILVPIFGYLLRTRRKIRRVVRQQDAQRQEELDSLASLGKNLDTQDNNSS